MNRTAVFAIIVLLLGGCAAQLVRAPVPANLVEQAQVAHLPGVRYWGDALPKNIEQKIEQTHRQSLAMRPHLFKNGQRIKANFLAISGGGSDGAFGAGLLKGWSEKGSRPEFDLVTAVSTGALAAPFVFLGPDYNRQLEEMYTHYSTHDLIEPQLILGLLGGASIADNTKLANVIASYVDYKLLRAVAKEHNRGRRLLIGTTNLDAQRPVVWDMGQIAQGNNKQALTLFRNVLLASAAIPGIFPPVTIDVTANGQTLQELHVDGGTTGQVFFLPPQLLIDSLIPKSAKKRKTRRRMRLNLYVVMNLSLAPKWKAVEATTTKIAGRSLVTLMKQQAVSDLYKLYVEAGNNKIEFNLASIPKSFSMVSSEPFDKAYMTALFGLGRDLGKQGYVWSKLPPRPDRKTKTVGCNSESVLHHSPPAAEILTPPNHLIAKPNAKNTNSPNSHRPDQRAPGLGPHHLHLHTGRIQSDAKRRNQNNPVSRRRPVRQRLPKQPRHQITPVIIKVQLHRAPPRQAPHPQFPQNQTDLPKYKNGDYGPKPAGLDYDG